MEGSQEKNRGLRQCRAERERGSARIEGFKSMTDFLLDYLQRSTGELASYQKKLIRIDDHLGIAIAGLTSDARVLSYVSAPLSPLSLVYYTLTLSLPQQLHAHASHVVSHALQPSPSRQPHR